VPRFHREFDMERATAWKVAGVLVLAAALAIGIYRWWGPAGRPERPAPTVEAPVTTPPAPAAAPEVAFPLPGEPPEAAMKAPAEAPGDALAAFEKDLASTFDGGAFARFVGIDDLVRRVVATVDNLASDQLPMRIRAMRATPGAFAVARDGDAIVMSPENARRYDPLVQFVESVDTRRAAALYTRHYRLFQGEYRGQGSPDRYFNDRVVASIDHLLATPDVTGPVMLVQPQVQYRFADPKLESLSAGQKALIRMGPENAAKIKAKLRAIRAEVARSNRAQQAGAAAR
jgi:hypothetical protein